MANLLCGKWRIAHTFSACQKGVVPAETACLSNYLRVEKYLFTRKEIFTYTLKKNYLHVSNSAMCCFGFIKTMRINVIGGADGRYFSYIHFGIFH